MAYTGYKNKPTWYTISSRSDTYVFSEQTRKCEAVISTATKIIRSNSIYDKRKHFIFAVSLCMKSKAIVLNCELIQA